MITEIEKKIGYKFKNKKLLSRALVHSSYANERNGKDNERLEFLGDSVLGFITAERLFGKLPESHEGSLTKLRAALVCENSLFELAKKIDLQNYLLLGKGEEATGGRNRPSVLSDAFEALVAAIYLDAGLFFVREWLLALMEDAFEDAIAGNRFNDHKTKLQEKVQAKHIGKISYRVASESGPDHSKCFEVEVLLDEKVLAKATGPSKKSAEQNAAKLAIDRV